MLLEVVTRCYKRPEMLKANQASLQAQVCPNWFQTLLVDEVGMGVPASNAQMSKFAPSGDYVWILDDDDVCIDRWLTTEIERVAAQHTWPPAIMLRMDHGPLGVLPDDDHWAGEPVQNYIGCSAIVTRRDVWNRHRFAWGSRYAADFDFIYSVWSEWGDDIVWLDRVASKVQRISHGAPAHA